MLEVEEQLVDAESDTPATTTHIITAQNWLTTTTFQSRASHGYARKAFNW
ncbi:hypothetical protein [Saccharopolyspora sp. NPDC002376]